MMTDLLVIFAVAAVLMAFVVNIALWSKRHLLVKAATLMAAAGFFVVVYVGFSNLLSRPKPVEIEWAKRAVPEATVLGVKMQEGEAIYLWLGVDGSVEPRSYVLPWDKTAARELHEAQQTAEVTGTEVKMRLPFRRPGEIIEEEQFYAPPQPAAPQKE